MTLIPLALLTAASLTAATTLAQAPAAPLPTATPAVLPVQPPDIAAPKLDPKTGQPQAAFMAAHERFLAKAREGTTRLLFLGDSITAGWGSAGKEVWAKAFGAYQPANFGIGGDRTQHVLWRINNGELEGIKPRVTVIMIGTNNMATSPAAEIAKGVTRIVEAVRSRLPETKILLLAIFPRGERPAGNLGGFQAKIRETNAIISRLDDGRHVHFLDIGPSFTQGREVLDKAIMPDFLHLSPAGYQIWADAMSIRLAELMR